jgi:hypothetical protein
LTGYWRDPANRGKYELRPAVKKLHQLRPKVSASRISVASRVVNPKHDELRRAVSKELYQLHRKIWAYKMSNNWKVLTQFYFTLLYTQLYAHIQNCLMISTLHSCYIILWSNVYTLLKNLFGEEGRHIMFLILPISSYCYDLMQTLSPEGVLMQ